MGIAKKYRLVTENNFGQDDISFTPNVELRKNLQDIEDDYPTRDTDFILRSGTFQRQAKDAERFGKFFTSPEGLLFTAKQNVLSRTDVATEASGKILGIGINGGAYLPTTTLSQIASSGTGFHQTRNGLENTIVGGIASFIGLNPPGQLPQYTEVVDQYQRVGDNRLVGFYEDKVNIQNKFRPLNERQQGIVQGLRRSFDKVSDLVGPSSILNKLEDAADFVLGNNDPTELYTYDGGPGSDLGIGSTRIGRYSNTTLEAQIAYNPKITEQLSAGGQNEVLDPSAIDTLQETLGNDINPGKIKDELLSSRLFDRVRNTADDITGGLLNTDAVNIEGIDDASPESNPNDLGGGSPYFTLTSDEIHEKAEESSQARHRILPDFRREFDFGDTKIIGDGGFKDPISAFIDTRVNHGEPGNNQRHSPGGLSGAIDKINYMPLYESGLVATTDSVKNDLVKFRIAAVNTDDPSKAVYMHFRAFLESFNDNYNSEWNGVRYMGRGEQFYKYNGFNRGISLSWKVVAQSKPELIQMYTKLNFLASNLSPDYTSAGYMGGPLVRLTVGGYLYEQYGFISSLDYTIPENSPWELGISPRGEDNRGVGGTSEEDNQVNELPLYMDVSMNFTPIHDFAPEKQKNNYFGDKGEVTSFGLQKYISLATKETYKDGQGNLISEDNYDRAVDKPLIASDGFIQRERASTVNEITPIGISNAPTPVTTQAIKNAQASQPKTRKEQRQAKRAIRQANRRLSRAGRG